MQAPADSPRSGCPRPYGSISHNKTGTHPAACPGPMRLLQRVFLRIGVVEVGIVLAAALLDLGEVLVRVEAARARLDKGDGDVRAVVGHALVVRQQVVEHEAVLDRALAALQALDVRRLGGGDQAVDDLLQRLNVARHFEVVLAEGIDGQLQNLRQCVCQVLQLRSGILGEDDVLVVDLLSRLAQVDGMVAQTLEVADGVQHVRDLPRVRDRQ